MRKPAMLRPVGQTSRRSRRPTHTFQVKHMPWAIQPFMIAPVLPGETLKNVLLQSRAVTKPIKNGLIGWWLEYHLFYVKHRDLDDRDILTDMMLDPEAVVPANPANAENYHFGGKPDWVQKCYKRVVDTYFRDEDEIGLYTIGNRFAAQIGNQNWTDSLVPEDHFGASTDLDVDLDADGTVTASEVDSAMRMWEFLRANKLTDASYEDYLATFGIRTPPAESHRPELIRSVRQWQYPVNHVDPATGAPSSAVSWVVAERADKSRFFTEPGFVFGVTIARPKVYLGNQSGSLVGVMDNAISWLPAILSDDPYTSVKPFAAGAHPLPSSTDGYWVDLKDLFLYGDQFINFATATDDNRVALPANAIANKRYATATDVAKLFIGSTDADRVITQDGIAHLDILGHMVDTTPQGIQA